MADAFLQFSLSSTERTSVKIADAAARCEVKVYPDSPESGSGTGSHFTPHFFNNLLDPSDQ